MNYAEVHLRDACKQYLEIMIKRYWVNFPRNPPLPPIISSLVWILQQTRQCLGENCISACSTQVVKTLRHIKSNSCDSLLLTQPAVVMKKNGNEEVMQLWRGHAIMTVSSGKLKHNYVSILSTCSTKDFTWKSERVRSHRLWWKWQIWLQ